MSFEITLYERIGGSEGLDRLVSAFIQVILEDAGLAELRSIYINTNLDHYAARLKEFLSGWLGGPPIYIERHGMPMLRESHRSLVITSKAMFEWMSAMRAALAQTVEDKDLRLKLEGAFAKMAESLVNSH